MDQTHRHLQRALQRHLGLLGRSDDLSTSAGVAKAATDLLNRLASEDPAPYPGDWGRGQGEEYNAWMRRQESLFDAIPSKRIVSFPVADGYAHYFVKSISPLVLQLIPLESGYRIPAAHLRGLTADDVAHKSNGGRETYH